MCVAGLGAQAVDFNAWKLEEAFKREAIAAVVACTPVDPLFMTAILQIGHGYADAHKRADERESARAPERERERERKDQRGERARARENEYETRFQTRVHEFVTRHSML